MSQGNTVTAIIVEDEEIMRGVLKATAESVGIDVVGEAGNGRAGIDLAVELEPDMILLDVLMPELNGFLALQEIVGRVPNAFVVMLTGIDDDEVARQCMLEGAQDFIRKTKPMSEIAERLDNHRHALSTRKR